jgi:plasmid stabilization system protein ParE
MVERSIVWTETAIKQRREILRYWTIRNGSTSFAERLIKLISKQLQIIALQPESFKETEFPAVRESAMGHFSIYYKTQDNQLIIMAFWDNRQDPKKLLEMLTWEKQ